MESVFVEPKAKIISLKAPRNPELEKIRDRVLSEKVDFNVRALQLKDQVRQIHAAYLFSVSGRGVLSTLCKVVSSTPPSPFISSWKDLGSELGLSNQQMGCIELYNYSDPTELTLKAYAQNWESTLDGIVDALQSINRFDAIVEAEYGLQELARVARQEQIRRTEDINEGMKSYFGKGTSDGILRPEHFSLITHQLPITLKTFPEKTSFMIEVQKCEAKLQNSCAFTKKKEKKFSKAVMLTFADDGEEIAFRVARELRKSRGRHLPIGVLLLREHADKVQENPEQFISHIFPQMNYIMPILTEGYFLALKDGNLHQGSTLSSIDAKFVKFIHDLMMKEYVNNDCKNKRFRCLIPDNELQITLSNKHMDFDPVLKVWVKESELEKVASRILKMKKKIC